MPPTEPDWDKLQSLSRREAELRASGQWNRETYRALFRDTVRAANGLMEAVGGVNIYADPKWIAELDEDIEAGRFTF